MLETLTDKELKNIHAYLKSKGKDSAAQAGDKKDGGLEMSEEERKKLEAKAAEDAKAAEAAKAAEIKAADDKAAAEAKAKEKDAEIKSLQDELKTLKDSNEKLAKEVGEMKATLEKPILKAFLSSGKQEAAKVNEAAEKKSKESGGPLDHL